MELKTAGQKVFRGISLITPLALISFFLLFPVVSVLISGVVDNGIFTLTYLKQIISDAYYWKLLGFTLAQAFLSTLLTLIFGIPIGYIFGKYEFSGRKIFLTLFTVPFVLPSVLVGMGFLVIFGENGLFGSPFLSIIIAHTFYNIPLVIHFFSAIYQNFDRTLVDAGKTLGSKDLQILLRIYLPLFLQPILTAALLTFNFCFMSFGIIILLGQAKFRTLETQIFAEVSKGAVNTAAALAVMQLLVTIGYILCYIYFIGKDNQAEKTMETGAFPRKKISLIQSFFQKKERRKAPEKRKTMKNTIVTLSRKTGLILKKKEIYLFIIFLFGLVLELAPMLSIVINSFWEPQKGIVTLKNYLIIFTLKTNNFIGVSIPKTVLNTVLFAFGSSLIATMLAVITILALGRKRLAKISLTYELVTYLPLAISSVTLSLGILQTFINVDFFINNPWLFIIISHGLLGYPFITRALLNGLNTISPEMEEASKTLGANRLFKIRKIYLPLLLPSIVAGIAFSFGLSLGEFTTANFFYLRNSSVATLTVALYRLRAVRQFGESSAIGVILLLLSYCSFFLIEKLGGRERTQATL
ncbi:MAG: ABC transporter permease subunit [Candidatus Heimdallarchaeota archaeon]|nr:ABC transporter permease subunit [Candidatus Heimdallarchaeota archaeon]